VDQESKELMKMTMLVIVVLETEFSLCMIQ